MEDNEINVEEVGEEDDLEWKEREMDEWGEGGKPKEEKEKGKTRGEGDLGRE